MTDRDNQIIQLVNTAYIAVQNINMPATIQNHQMLDVAYKNIQAILQLMQESNDTNKIKK